MPRLVAEPCGVTSKVVLNLFGGVADRVAGVLEVLTGPFGRFASGQRDEGKSNHKTLFHCGLLSVRVLHG